MKAVITVVGYDDVGILAKVAAVCADNHANIIDVTQSGTISRPCRGSCTRSARGSA